MCVNLVRVFSIRFEYKYVDMYTKLLNQSDLNYFQIYYYLPFFMLGTVYYLIANYLGMLLSSC